MSRLLVWPLYLRVQLHAVLCSSFAMEDTLAHSLQQGWLSAVGVAAGSTFTAAFGKLLAKVLPLRLTP